jgi:hypothetical protein
MDTESLRNKVLNDTLDVIIANLEKNAISEAEIAPIADFILARIDSVNNEIDVTAFLSELSAKWPMFRNIASIQQGENQEKVEGEVAQGVLSLAQSGKIDEALSLAKSVTQPN